MVAASVIKVDGANDLALLKAEGRFSALPVAASRAAKLGGTVATIGFPNVGLQGFAPKLAKGEIASLAGAADDARYFQISVPVQPGNSGGALVDERGNVVSVVSDVTSLAPTRSKFIRVICRRVAAKANHFIRWSLHPHHHPRPTLAAEILTLEREIKAEGGMHDGTMDARENSRGAVNGVSCGAVVGAGRWQSSSGLPAG